MSCVVSMTDSTTSAGWLRKSNFNDDGDTDKHMLGKFQTARSHALRMLKYDIKEYSQWFRGKHNIIADSLSRDFHLSDNELTSLFHSIFPNQIPLNFNIVPLPPKIVSWLCTWLQQMPETKRLQEEHQPSRLEHGPVGYNSSNPSICTMMNTWTTSDKPNESTSSQPSPTRYAPLNTQNQKFLDWVKNQSEIPWTMWRRPSGVVKGLIQDWTQTANLHDFYNSSTKAIKQRTPLQNNKKHSPASY